MAGRKSLTSLVLLKFTKVLFIIPHRTPAWGKGIDSKELTVWKACVEREQQLTSMETVRFQAAQRLGEVGGVTGSQLRKCHKPSSLRLDLRSSLVLISVSTSMLGLWTV